MICSMPKQPKGHAKKSPDSRRNGSRIAISPSCIAKVDELAECWQMSRADILEQLIEKEYCDFVVRHNLRKLGLIE
jgi:predicted Rossmann fold nucleotide-binding protein DprA/Smf involved in DNA uptake